MRANNSTDIRYLNWSSFLDIIVAAMKAGQTGPTASGDGPPVVTTAGSSTDVSGNSSQMTPADGESQDKAPETAGATDGATAEEPMDTTQVSSNSVS